MSLLGYFVAFGVFLIEPFGLNSIVFIALLIAQGNLAVII